MIVIYVLQWRSLHAAVPEPGTRPGGSFQSAMGGRGNLELDIGTHTAVSAVVTAVVFAGNVYGLSRTLRMLADMRRVMCACICPAADGAERRTPRAPAAHAQVATDEERHVRACYSMQQARICVNGAVVDGSCSACPRSISMESPRPQAEAGPCSELDPTAAALPPLTVPPPRGVHAASGLHAEQHMAAQLLAGTQRGGRFCARWGREGLPLVPTVGLTGARRVRIRHDTARMPRRRPAAAAQPG